MDGDCLDDRPKAKDVPDHEIDLVGAGRWIEARHLRIGDVLLLQSGETTRIKACNSSHKKQPVYNLWVDEVHTYGVGTNSILVHNNTEECAKIIQATVKGIGVWTQQGIAYEDFVAKTLRAVRDAPVSGALEGGTGHLSKLVVGGTVADFDGFLGNVWYECKTSLSNVTDIQTQLGRELKVASYYGKQLRLYAPVSTANIPADLINWCKNKGIEIVSFGGVP